MLPAEQVLVVLYVACLVLRLPVTPMGIKGQALSGALPFFEHLGRAGEALDPADQLGLSALLRRPGDPPSLQRLRGLLFSRRGCLLYPGIWTWGGYSSACKPGMGRYRFERPPLLGVLVDQGRRTGWDLGTPDGRDCVEVSRGRGC